MAMNILLWIIFGALAGWIGSMIAGTNREQGAFMNIVVGIIGAMLGGWIVRALGVGAGVSGFNLPSLLVAILGSVILLFIVRAFTGRAHHV